MAGAEEMQERPKDDISGSILKSGGISLLLYAVMLAVYASLGKLTGQVALGGLIGLAAAMLNLILLGNAVRDAMSAGDQTIASQKLRASYTGRMLLMVAATALAFVLPAADALACIIALLFPRFGIMLIQLFLKFRKKESSGGNV